MKVFIKNPALGIEIQYEPISLAVNIEDITKWLKYRIQYKNIGSPLINFYIILFYFYIFIPQTGQMEMKALVSFFKYITV